VALQFDGPAPHPIDRDIKLLIYVGDLAMPRATVRIADLVRVGNERPLNLRRRKDDVVRLILRDPNGTWASGAPKFSLSLNTV
jgi:Ca-activated chloride channel family protein